MIRPRLVPFRRPGRLADYPVGTCAPAGHLVTTSESFRNSRPLLSADRCTGCWLCYLYCPDAAIERRERSIAIDLDFCKGCGICACECPAESVVMVPEEGGNG